MRCLTKFIILSSLLATTMLSACSSGRQAFSSGEKLEAEGRYEEAMYSYADAFSKDQNALEYRVRFLSAREKAANSHYKQGLVEFASGNYSEALSSFQSAYGLDPSQSIFKQKVDQTYRLKNAKGAYQEGLDFESNNKLKDATINFARAVELDPENKDYQSALKRISGMRKNKLAGHELSLKSSKPITLKFKDSKIKDVFSILTRLSGINFIFDDAIKDQNITIYLENATFQQVMDLLSNMFKLSYKVLNESTVVVYPKLPDKVKQYEEMEVRTFHLNYIEAKKAVNLIRGMLQVRKLQINEDNNSLVVRDTRDVVDVVEKIIDANDVPDAEVVLDVEVIEMSDTNAQNVGLLLSNYSVQMGAFAPDGTQLASTLSSATPSVSNSTSSGTPVTVPSSISGLIRAFSSNGYGAYVTVPNATYNFGKTLGKGEVLSNPKIRVKNKEKAKFTVGTRVPITTTSTTGTAGGYNVNVQYVDIGVKLNAEPTIQLNNEIVIKLSLEVSQQVGAPQDVGNGTTVVTIGTRNLETVLSLKDGETSIIGGLIQRNNTKNVNKIFLLGDLPLIGPLLSNYNTNKSKTELMLAITPRLVRGVTVPKMDVSAFMSGKEDEPSITRPLASFEEEPLFEGDINSSEGKDDVLSNKSISKLKAEEKAARKAAGTNQNAATGLTTQPSINGAIVNTTPPTGLLPQELQSTRGLLQAVIPAVVSSGQEFSVDAKVALVNNLVSAGFTLTYDNSAVELLSSVEGGYLKQDGESTTALFKPNQATGLVVSQLSRMAGKAGASGAGTLATFLFKAKKAGQANFGFTDLNFISATGAPIDMVPFVKPVNIQKR